MAPGLRRALVTVVLSQEEVTRAQASRKAGDAQGAALGLGRAQLVRQTGVTQLSSSGTAGRDGLGLAAPSMALGSRAWLPVSGARIL